MITVFCFSIKCLCCNIYIQIQACPVADVSFFNNHNTLSISFFAEPPKSFSIIQNNKEVEHGGQITVVDGKVRYLGPQAKSSELFISTACIYLLIEAKNALLITVANVVNPSSTFV